MKIGDLTLKTTKPDKLDDQLIALAGISATEMQAELVGVPLASTVASAIMPFVSGTLTRPELADAIAAVGVETVLPDVRALYEKAPDATQTKA